MQRARSQARAGGGVAELPFGSTLLAPGVERLVAETAAAAAEPIPAVEYASQYLEEHPQAGIRDEGMMEYLFHPATDTFVHARYPSESLTREEYDSRTFEIPSTPEEHQRKREEKSRRKRQERVERRALHHSPALVEVLPMATLPEYLERHYPGVFSFPPDGLWNYGYRPEDQTVVVVQGRATAPVDVVEFLRSHLRSPASEEELGKLAARVVKHLAKEGADNAFRYLEVHVLYDTPGSEELPTLAFAAGGDDRWVLHAGAGETLPNPDVLYQVQTVPDGRMEPVTNGTLFRLARAGRIGGSDPTNPVIVEVTARRKRKRDRERERSVPLPGPLQPSFYENLETPVAALGGITLEEAERNLNPEWLEEAARDEREARLVERAARMLASAPPSGDWQEWLRRSGIPPAGGDGDEEQEQLREHAMAMLRIKARLDQVVEALHQNPQGGPALEQASDVLEQLMVDALHSHEDMQKLLAVFAFELEQEDRVPPLDANQQHILRRLLGHLIEADEEARHHDLHYGGTYLRRLEVDPETNTIILVPSRSRQIPSGSSPPPTLLEELARLRREHSVPFLLRGHCARIGVVFDESGAVVDLDDGQRVWVEYQDREGEPRQYNLRSAVVGRLLDVQHGSWSVLPAAAAASPDEEPVELPQAHFEMFELDNLDQEGRGFRLRTEDEERPIYLKVRSVRCYKPDGQWTDHPVDDPHLWEQGDLLEVVSAAIETSEDSKLPERLLSICHRLGAEACELASRMSGARQKRKEAELANPENLEKRARLLGEEEEEALEEEEEAHLREEEEVERQRLARSKNPEAARQARLRRRYVHDLEQGTAEGEEEQEEAEEMRVGLCEAARFLLASLGEGLQSRRYFREEDLVRAREQLARYRELVLANYRSLAGEIQGALNALLRSTPSAPVVLESFFRLFPRFAQLIKLRVRDHAPPSSDVDALSDEIGTVEHILFTPNLRPIAHEMEELGGLHPTIRQIVQQNALHGAPGPVLGGFREQIEDHLENTRMDVFQARDFEMRDLQEVWRVFAGWVGRVEAGLDRWERFLGGMEDASLDLLRNCAALNPVVTREQWQALAASPQGLSMDRYTPEQAFGLRLSPYVIMLTPGLAVFRPLLCDVSNMSQQLGRMLEYYNSRKPGMRRMTFDDVHELYEAKRREACASNERDVPGWVRRQITAR